MDVGARLNPGQFDVWYCWTQECLDAGLEAYYLSLLTEDETARMRRFKFEYLQHEYLVTRALCRSTLSRYAKVHPADWRFSANAYGRPEIAGPHTAEGLRFNLSNARSLVACVVATDVDAGIDVEETDRPGETLSIADRFFSRSELEALRAEPMERQKQRFFELWTLKESYIKARGMGLAIPLEKFSFDIGQRIGIQFDTAIDDDPDNWHFELHPLGARHMIAVCAGLSTASVCRINVRHCVPGIERIPGSGA